MEAITAPFPVNLLAVAALLLAVGFFVMVGKKSPAAGHRLPPSPWRLPVIGNLHQLIIGGRPHRALRDLAAVHGPVMLLHLGCVPTLVVSSPDAAREVLQEQDHAFASRPSLAVPTRLLYGCTDIAFAPHGAYWRAARKMAVHHLLGPARVRSYRAVREQEAAELVQRVEEEASRHGGVVELTDLLSAFAKDVTGRIILGVRASGGSGWQAKVDSLLHEANALLGRFHVGDYFPWLAWVAAVDGTDAKVRSAFERSDRILEEILVNAAAAAGTGSARRNHNHDDAAFLHELLSLQNDHGSTADVRLTRDNVKAIVEDLFGAGTDAIIIVLEWAMAELLRNKKVMHKLQQEIRRSRFTTTTNNNLIITEQELQIMEYLRAVIKETIRLHPASPVLLPRESMQQTKVHGYDVPCGTRVIVNAWAIGRDPVVWDRADEFWPERFVGSEVNFRGQHFHYIPFGAGRRMCPGINYVMPVVELVLANLVERFDWEPVPKNIGGAPEVVDIEEAPGQFALRKNVPLRAIAKLPA